MKKVLIGVKDLRIGNGVANCIMNYYASTLKAGYNIDFLLCQDVDSPWVDEVKNSGNKICLLPDGGKKISWRNIKFLYSTLPNYDIIHINFTGRTAVMVLFVAYRLKLKCRIFHAHNPRECSSVKAIIRSLIFDNISVLLSNRYISCSESAGKSIFGKRRFEVLTNALNVQKYSFSESSRLTLREQLNISGSFVIGVVGRISEQKNPFFVIDVFSKVKEKVPESVLLWIGDGELKGKVIQYATQKGVINSVILLGVRKDVNVLYSVMDAFLLPSFFEGLGFVFVEAQISGLKCYGSLQIPRDVSVTDNMTYLDIKDNAQKWANAIISQMNYTRKDQSENVRKAGFDITSESRRLASLYDIASRDCFQNGEV